MLYLSEIKRAKVVDPSGVEIGRLADLAVVPREQFLNAAGELTVKRGDAVDVMIDHGEQVEGYVLLSHTKAARLRIWDDAGHALIQAHADEVNEELERHLAAAAVTT